MKQLDRTGNQGSREFCSEILLLSFAQHPNLVNLIGYCAEGNERIVIYEYMLNGSLEDHIFGNVYSFGYVYDKEGVYIRCSDFIFLNFRFASR